MPRLVPLALIVSLMALVSTASAGTEASSRVAVSSDSGAVLTDSSCYANPGNPNAPWSVDASLPFWVRFGGQTFRDLEVSNQGYVSFRRFLASDPDYDHRSLRLSWEGSTFNIAPFWSIGTSLTETGARTTSWGTTTFQGHPAFCANWIDSSPGNTCVSPPHPVDWSKKNRYQLLLVDRSDAAYEDFDIVFNYGRVQWDRWPDCGNPAGAGYSLATPGSGELLSGSWTSGSFVDSNLTTGLIHGSQGSSQLGRFVWEVRNGQVTPSVTTGGTYGVPTATLPGAWAENPTNDESEPVNTATGSYFTSSTDLSHPGIGVPHEHTRTYNSADPSSGVLGPGWTHALAAALTIQPNGDVLAKSGDGQEIVFVRNPDGTFTAPGFARSSLASVSGGYELLTGDQIRFRFDAQGRLTSKRDRNGQGLTLGYGGDGLLASVTDSVGRTITYTHSGGLLRQVALPDGRRVAYTYDPSGRLETVTDARDGVTRYTYDTGGRLKTIVDQNSHTVVDNTYGPDGRVVEQRDARDNRSTFAWDAVSQTSTYTDARLKQWKDVYRDNVLVEQIDPLGNRTLYRYDGNLNLTNVIDPRGNQTTMTYDARGNLLTRTPPAPGTQEVWTYTALNDPLTFRDGRGNVTTYEYDAAGNLTAVRAPGVSAGQPVTRYGRDPAGTGLLTSITDPRGKQTTFQYTNGNLTEIRTPLGSRTTMGYDSSGRMTSLVDPRGNAAGANAADYTWTYTYLETNQLETQTDPLGNATTLAYDPAGNLVSRADPKGHLTSYGYDEANHLTSVTAPDPDGAGPLAAPVTRYTYDPVGNLDTRQDANLRTTSYESDAVNRLTRATRPGGRVWTYAYDGNGNVTQIVDANGNATPTAGDGQTTFAYDTLNRLTSINYSDATPDVTFQYDGNGNRTRMTDGSGTEGYAYDALNRLTTVSRPGATFTYFYDLANLTQTWHPDSTTVSYAHDDDERLRTVTSAGQTTNYGYDEAGNLTQTTLPSGNGYVEMRSYDRAGRLTVVENKRGASTLSRFAITLDPAGNPLSVDRTGSLAQTQTYTYDDVDRLTSVCYQAGSCPGANDPFIRWTYDGVGNRLTEQRPSGTTTYSYTVADELLQAGATSYTYDQNGNQLSAGTRAFTYDLANRVRTTTLGNETTTYTYAGDGKRLQASTGTQAAKTTKFLWDVSAPIPQIALERNGNDALVRRYVYGARRISMASGNNTSYYLHDGLGSVANLTSSSGATQWTWSYEPFGAIRTETKASGGQPENLMRFTGEYLDPTGLYHLRARHYDSGVGRFLQLDPISPPLVEPRISHYAYVAGRPTVLIDPLGLWGISVCASGEASFIVVFTGKVCVHVTGNVLPSEFGTSVTGSVGVAPKAGVDVGLDASISDAQHVADYGGPSYSGGVFIQAGGGVDFWAQRGPASCGRELRSVGIGVNAGLSLGGGPHFERNETTVTRTTGPYDPPCPGEHPK